MTYTLRAVIASCSLVMSISVFAQVETSVMREGEITESGLVEALTPSVAPSVEPANSSNCDPPAPPGVKCRNIFIRPVHAAPPAPKANLLITFETDSASLTESAKKSLDVVARALAADRLAAFRFVIEGHADPRGDPRANQRLSEARARSVLDYLVGTRGIAAGRLKVVGMGSTAPLKPDQPAAPENRRVTIVTSVD